MYFMEEELFVEVWCDVDSWTNVEYTNMRLLREKPTGTLEAKHIIYEIGANKQFKGITEFAEYMFDYDSYYQSEMDSAYFQLMNGNTVRSSY